MLSLQVFLFGVPRIERDGETIFVRRRKVMALLAYLAVTSQLHSRDVLATLFWPEYDQSSARGNLRRDLSQLKRALGDGVLLVDRMQVSMNPKVALWLDVATFQMNLAKVRQHEHPSSQLCPDCNMALTEAVTLYSDDFMAGFTLRDSPEFDEWQFFQAESLRNSLAGALQQLIQWHVGQGEYERAIEYGRRWLGLDPLHESAQRQLMRLYAWSGQQAAALRQYQECVRLLDEELTVEPEEETKALYEAIKARQLEMPARGQGSRGAGEIVAQGHLLPADQYVQQELLMVSGQGEVYRGLDRVSNEPVVIKRLHPDLVARRPELVARLVREGKALSRLNHPNIVRMLATLEQDGEHALVMEYVAGGSLRQLLDGASQLPQEQALDIALELADALSRAHHLSIIHRDLKPDNVLLAADGTPRLTDFGMARLGGDEARLTQTGSFIGSPAYMSPEALRGEEVDARSDVWSFGVLLYEMLAGRRPFTGTHITSVLVSILNDPVPELQQFRPEVPPPLAYLLQQILVKEREGRIASMRQVAAELEAIRAGRIEGITPQPPLSPAVEERGVEQAPILHNRLSHPTPFIGREQELADITNTLASADTRLLTITGPGGIGKTRLALAVADRVEHTFSSGAWFVSLAPLQSAEHLVSALANSLDFHFGGNDEPKAQLLRYLSRKHLLLVLDNFEHLLDAAELLMEIVGIAPGVKILTTSRERLNLSDEMVYTLGGMTYPDWQRAIDTDVTAYSAVQLLLQRARLVRPDLEPEGENLVYAARICQLVEGMPLALVLAAGWLEILSLEEIADEIAQSLDFLETEMRDVPERQRSVRAVFESSWRRLTPQEQRSLSALSVFRGGFRREAAQRVAGAELATLRKLANKSLIGLTKEGRYEIHELLRQYAAEKLVMDKSRETQIRDQHAAYFATQLQKWYGKMKGPNSAEAFAAVTADTANVQAAWRWLVTQRHFDVVVEQMLPGFFRYCEIRLKAPLLLPLIEMTRDALVKNESEHQKFLAILLTVQAAFNRGGVSIRFEVFDIILPMYKEALDQAWAIASKRGLLPEMGVWSIVLAWVYGWSSNLEDGLAALTELLPHVREHSDRWELAFARQCLGHLQHKVLGWENAGQNLSEALHLFQETGDEHEIGFTQRLLGILRLMQQRSTEAKLHLQAAQTRLEDVGDLEVAAEVNWHLADVHFRLGESDEAFRYLRVLRQTHLNLGRTEAAIRALSREGYEALRYGTIDRARETRRQTLALAKEVDDTFSEAWYIWEMGEICRVAGEEEAARRWYDKAKRFFERVPDDNGAAFYHRGLGDLAHAQGDYQEAQRRFRLSLELAQQMKHSWAESYAAAGLGRALLASGQSEAAREPLLTALQIARQTADTGLILLVLARIAGWHGATGGHERAVALAALVLNHDASWNETKAQAQVVLAAAAVRLSAEQAVAAQERGKWLDLGETAAQLIEEFVRPGVSHNLPTQPTPFIGREEELADIVNKLAEPNTRLLTLTGPGGIGKTRLSLAVAGVTKPAFPDGVYFVPLASLESAEHIASALADSLHHQFGGSRELEEQLFDYLHRRRMLLVLDNFEHLLEGAELVARILESAPDVKVLTTSRERLNLSGEMVYSLGGMTYPDLQRVTKTDASAYSAIQLLLQRARLVRADLKLEGESLVDAVRVCQLVEGMPLALVLAAGWVEVLSLAEIATEIAQSLDFLETEMRDVPERQRSIRAVFDSSWKRLSPDEQRVFMKLTVFRGGFTRQAAQHVTGAGVRTLRSLVNKLFITAGREDRYEIHELLRQYGEEKLVAEGEAEEAQDQHFRFYLALATEAEPHLSGELPATWLARLGAEHDNLRAALAWSLSGKGGVEVSAGSRMAHMLEQFWDFGGYYQEALNWLRRLLAQMEVAEPEATAEQAYALLDARRFATTLGDFIAARAYGEEALILFQRVKDDIGIALTLAVLAFLDVQQDKYTTAQLRLEEALLLAKASGDREVLCHVLSAWGLLAWRQGDYATAQSHLEEALTLARLKGNIDNIKILLYHLGNVAFYRGDFVNAEALHQESLALAQEVGDRVHVDWSLVTLGDLAFVQGDYEQARAAYLDNLARLRELGSQQGQAMALLGAGKLATHDGNFAVAHSYLSECLNLQETMGSRLGIAETMEAFAHLNIAQAEADDTSKKSERLQQAAQLYGAADALRASIGAPLPPVFQPFQDSSIAAIRARLNDTDFATAWERGKALARTVHNRPSASALA